MQNAFVINMWDLASKIKEIYLDDKIGWVYIKRKQNLKKGFAYSYFHFPILRRKNTWHWRKANKVENDIVKKMGEEDVDVTNMPYEYEILGGRSSNWDFHI